MNGEEEVYVITQKGSVEQTGSIGVVNPMVFKTFEDCVRYVENTYVKNCPVPWEIENKRNPKWHGIGLITIVVKEDDKVVRRSVFKTFISRLVSYAD